MVNFMACQLDLSGDDDDDDDDDDDEVHHCP